MFRITSGKGFQITFDNGWMISVQFGWGNYCDNRDSGFTSDYQSLTYREQELGADGCDNAEIAIFDPNGHMLSFGPDTVKGWVYPDEVAFWIFWTRCQKREDTVYNVTPDILDPGILDIDTETDLIGINVKPL